MGAGASPYVVFRRAIERRSLLQAEAAARELPHLSPADSLSLLLLLRSERDARYERAAVRWLGQVLAGHPHIGFELAEELVKALVDLNGGNPDGATTRLRLILKTAGLPDAARVAELA